MTHRILVVDDEPDITALVAYHLAKVGYRVSTAANGPEALKAAREERPDVVVTDIRNHWAAPWITMVARAGVIEPFPNHTFQPRAVFSMS